jgi:hypothetical protein
MSRYIRKTRDVWEVRGNYGHGWEMVTAELSREAARERRNEYRANEPGVSFIIVKTREPIRAILEV